MACFESVFEVLQVKMLKSKLELFTSDLICKSYCLAVKVLLMGDQAVGRLVTEISRSRSFRQACNTKNAECQTTPHSFPLPPIAAYLK